MPQIDLVLSQAIDNSSTLSLSLFLNGFSLVSKLMNSVGLSYPKRLMGPIKAFETRMMNSNDQFDLLE